MKYQDSNDAVVVSTDGTDGPYILLDHNRLDEVHALLVDKRIPHSLDPDAIEANGNPSMSVINLPDDIDISLIQSLLDSLK